MTEDNLLKGRGLPVSNMTAVMINLKTYSHLPELRSMRAEWYEQEREAGWGNPRPRGRDKRRFDDY